MEVMAMMKVMMVSTGVVLMAVMLKLSLPVVLEFFSSELSFLWFRPPYLYLIINCIILSIVVSSKLQPSGDEVSEKLDVVEVTVKTAAKEEKECVVDEVPAVEEVVKEVVFGYVEESDLVMNDEKVLEEEEMMATAAEIGGGDLKKKEGVANGGEEEEEFTVMKSKWILPEDLMAAKAAGSVEKPPVSARFARRRSVKSSPEGKAVLKKVSRPKKQETLESTWRTLTEGRPIPLTRHLRKSDTFNGTRDLSRPVRALKKSDTISGSTAVNVSSGSGVKLRREASMSQDELNRRVEAFIKKFNEEMRLQRQESINQYNEMISRA